MIRALYSAASGMTAQQLNVDNIAHNLANANTAGYKTRHAQFQDLMYQSVVQPGSAAGQQTVVPTGLQVGLGTRTSSNEILFTQGSFSQTDNPLDLVIEGDGFFQVQLPDGQIGYTRDGTFKLDSQGRLVNSDGYVLQPEITVPAQGVSRLTIGLDGTVQATVAGNAAPQSLGQIQLSRFASWSWSDIRAFAFRCRSLPI